MSQLPAGVSAPDELFVRSYERDGATELVVDVGAPDASVDVLDDCIIVIAGSEQYELSVPTEQARTFMKNGVLTIRVGK